MILYIIGHDFHYELENICRIFYPFEKINILKEISPTLVDETLIITKRTQSDEKLMSDLSVELNVNGKVSSASAGIFHAHPDYENECERILAVMLFELFVKHTGYRPDWGALTGVRPAKLMRRLTDELGAEKAEEYFEKALLVSKDKTALCRRVSRTEEEIIFRSGRDSFSLYIAIPFCPSRCSYCSFVSHSVEKSAELVPRYVELLCKELEYTGRIAKELKLRLETVYIGGGTPTTLSPEQLASVMNAVRANFDLSNLLEYTVEAGRPDTITKDKLLAIKAGGADRISINPQTMNDDVLREIGRRHTAKQCVEAFNLAREVGFDNINMDLIAGLPLDTLDSFNRTLESIIALDPESVTIHTLAMKRSSNLNQSGRYDLLRQGKTVQNMLKNGSAALSKAEILPYYMYRQSKTVGGLENVGYSKIGCEGFYNVYIMDETHTILACGASGVTKLKQPGTNFLQRVSNYKYPYEYIRNFNEILLRKDKVKAFYEEYVK